MKKLFFVLGLLISAFAFGQPTPYDSTKHRMPQNAYGYDYNNILMKGSFVLPRYADTIRLDHTDTGAIAFYKNVVWFWNLNRSINVYRWDTLGPKVGGGGNTKAGTGSTVFSDSVYTNSVSVRDLTELANVKRVDPSKLYHVNYVAAGFNAAGYFQADTVDVSTTDDKWMVIVHSSGTRLKRVVPDGMVNVKWFGATGDGVQRALSTRFVSLAQAQVYYPFVTSLSQSIDWAAIQAAVFWVADRTQYRVVYIPQGNYQLSQGIDVKKDSNHDGQSEFFTGITITGDVGATTYGQAGIETFIKVNNGNSYGLNLQRVKGCRVLNLSFEGVNTGIASFSYVQIMDSANLDWAPGVRDSSQSAHNGIVVDGRKAGGSIGNRYPGEDSLYVNELATGGSSDVLMNNIRCRYFVVGVALSPHGSPQNGDNIWCINSWVDYCKVAFSSGQSQNRSIHLMNIKSWGVVETIMDCKRYGDGTADCFDVDGMQIAGAARYFCRLNNFTQSKGLTVQNLHCESIKSLGGNFEALLNKLHLQDSRIHLAGNCGTGAHFPKTLFQGDALKISGHSSVTFSCGTNYQPVVINANAAEFDGVEWEAVPFVWNLNGRMQAVTFTNCTGAGASYYWGNNMHYTGANPPEIQTSTIIAPNGTTVEYRRAATTRSYQRQIISSKDPNTDVNTGLYPIVNASANGVVTNINTGAQTARLELTPDGTDIKRMRAGDFAWTRGTDDFGNATQWMVLGRVDSTNNSLGYAYLSATMVDIAATTYSAIAMFKPKRFIPTLILGDAVSGNDTLKNVVVENFSTNVPTGAVIDNPNYPLGTYIKTPNIPGGYIVMSNPATASFTTTEVYSENWIAREVGVPYSGSTPYGYKKADIILNNDFVTYPDIIYWICSRSGIVNTAKTPLFTPFYLNGVKATNGTQNISANETGLGSDLTQNTFIDIRDKTLEFDNSGNHSNSGGFSVLHEGLSPTHEAFLGIYQTGVNASFINGTTGGQNEIRINDTALILRGQKTSGDPANYTIIKGDSTEFNLKASYSRNLGSTFKIRTLVDKGYVDSCITASIVGAGGMAIGGAISGATVGSVLFVGTTGTPALRQKNDQLYYDSANVRFAINAGTSPVSHFHLRHDAIGTTNNDAYGITLENTTDAANAAQQESPPMIFVNEAYKSNATAASQINKIRLRGLGVQGTTVSTTQFLIDFAINGAAFGTPLLTLASDGARLSTTANGLRILTNGGGNGGISFTGGGILGNQIRTTTAFLLTNESGSSGAGVTVMKYSSGPVGTIVNTSGTAIHHNFEAIFAPTSGTAASVGVQYDFTTNQTGGANGPTTGILINATNTAIGDAAGFTIFKIANAAGRNINGGTVENTNDISPSQITSNQNDYSPTGLIYASVLRLNTDASRNITGIAIPTDGKELTIRNIGSFDIVLKDQDAASTSANRFKFGADYTLAAGESIRLMYDATDLRWYKVTTTPNSSQESYTNEFTQTSYVTVSNTTTETTLVGSGEGNTTVESTHNSAGGTIKIVGSGVISTHASGNVDFDFEMIVGNVNLSTSFSGAKVLANGLTNSKFDFYLIITPASVSGSGNAVYDYYVTIDNNGSPVEFYDQLTTSTFANNSTVATDFNIQWVAAQSGNSCTLRKFETIVTKVK